MAKIMLVEDDTNLGEIYKARLEAEGYEIISAKDGEEALALAVKEHPDLIISDVMMPKISGFEMLDILRGTPGVQNTKVIMMTALSQAEDKSRADALGADRYLVKSQVTLEDVVQAAKDVLSSSAAPAPVPQAQPAAPAAATPTPAPAPAPVAPAPAPVPQATTADATQSATTEEATINQQIQAFVNQTPAAATPTPAPAPAPVAPAPAPVPQAQPAAPAAATPTPAPAPAPVAPAPAPVPQATTPTPSNADDGINIPGKKIIQPLNDPSIKPDLDALLIKEQQKELERTGAQPIVIAPEKPAVEASGYLGSNGGQAGAANPNNGSSFDPNSVAL